jgi:hypothetical protein
MHHTAIANGTHVLLRDHPIGVRLRAFGGTVARPDAEYDGYVIIRLDEPATYFHADGSTEELAEIVEAIDNLIVQPIHT